MKLKKLFIKENNDITDIFLNKISLLQNFISIEKNKKYQNIYDVFISNPKIIKDFNNIDIHFVLYPYDRRVGSKNINFTPFEEYISDDNIEHNTIYKPIPNTMPKIFGLSLGLIITLLFACFKPSILVSVESIVSIFAAYQFGKEVWQDIENMLSKISLKRITYSKPYYSFILERKTTLARYSFIARKKRIGVTPILPKMIDILWQNSSQTLRLKFDTHDFSESKLHIFSIHVDKVINYLEEGGYMIGLKLSLNNEFKSIELFQSIDNGEHGCLDNKDIWNKNKLYFKHIYHFGRFKYLFKDGLINLNLF